MNKFIGMLFFYSVIFMDKENKYRKEWGFFSKYVREKSRRYLGLTIQEVEWEFLKVLLKDFPEPIKDELTDAHLYELISIFDKVFKLKNINHEIRMFGIDEDIEKEQLREIFEDFSKYISIIGSSNGVCLTLGNWLDTPTYNRNLIEREINLIELI